MSFNRDFFKGLDMDRAAKEEFGTGASAVLLGDSHIWNWKARMPDGTYKPLNLNRAAINQHGAGHRAVAVGARGGDWKAIRLADIQKPKYIPTLLVCDNKIMNVTEVSRAIDCYSSHLIAAQEYYRSEIGETWDMVSPLVIYTGINERQFKDWNAEMAVPGPNQRNYFWELEKELKKSFETDYDLPNIRFITAVFGYQQDGSVSIPKFTIFDSVTCNVKYDIYTSLINSPSPCSGDCAYIAAHEIGHSCGLSHPASSDSDIGLRIMQSARPRVGYFNAFEKSVIKADRFIY